MPRRTSEAAASVALSKRQIGQKWTARLVEFDGVAIGILNLDCEEILSHRAVMAELFRVLTDEIPTGELKPSDFFEHLFAIHRPEVLLLVAVRTGGEPHLSFDDRDVGITQSDFVAGIGVGVCAAAYR